MLADLVKRVRELEKATPAYEDRLEKLEALTSHVTSNGLAGRWGPDRWIVEIGTNRLLVVNEFQNAATADYDPKTKEITIQGGYGWPGDGYQGKYEENSRTIKWVNRDGKAVDATWAK